jgi:hypothetical protein
MRSIYLVPPFSYIKNIFTLDFIAPGSHARRIREQNHRVTPKFRVSVDVLVSGCRGVGLSHPALSLLFTLDPEPITPPRRHTVSVVHNHRLELGLRRHEPPRHYERHHADHPRGGLVQYFSCG